MSVSEEIYKYARMIKYNNLDYKKVDYILFHERTDKMLNYFIEIINGINFIYDSSIIRYMSKLNKAKNSIKYYKTNIIFYVDIISSYDKCIEKCYKIMKKIKKISPKDGRTLHDIYNNILLLDIKNKRKKDYEKLNNEII